MNQENAIPQASNQEEQTAKECNLQEKEKKNGEVVLEFEKKEAKGSEEANSQVKEEVKKMMEELTAENFSEGMQKARQFKKEGAPEKCLDMLEAMTRKGAKLFGDYDVRLASPYFRLGDVLLQRIEEQNDVFGENFDKKTKGSGEGKEELSEREEAIKVAWQNIEIARVFLQKFLEKEGLELAEIREKSLLLAEVFKRLGECENLKENFTKAKEELTKAIKILEEVEEKETSRVLSENYFLMSLTIGLEGKPGCAKEAKIYIEKAIEIIQKLSESEKIEELKKAEFKEILKIMQQKKEDLKEEIEATNPVDKEAIQKAISKTAQPTSTAFPKPQLQGASVNKLGTFGKKSVAEKPPRKDQNESVSKKLQEPAKCRSEGKVGPNPKALKKVQTEASPQPQLS